jgi:hypothetical protein
MSGAGLGTISMSAAMTILSTDFRQTLMPDRRMRR